MLLTIVALVLAPVATAVCGTALTLCLTYLYFLNKHLNTSRFRRRTPLPSNEDLLKEGRTWPDIDVLKDSTVDKPTQKRYLVTGQPVTPRAGSIVDAEIMITINIACMQEQLDKSAQNSSSCSQGVENDLCSRRTLRQNFHRI